MVEEAIPTTTVRVNSSLNLFQRASFLSVCRQLLPCIQQGFREQGHTNSLPVNISIFLCEYFRLSQSVMKLEWGLVQDDVVDPKLDDFQHLMGRVQSNSYLVNQLHRLDLGTCMRLYHM